jgi:hypothetical protein
VASFWPFYSIRDVLQPAWARLESTMAAAAVSEGKGILIGYACIQTASASFYSSSDTT